MPTTKEFIVQLEDRPGTLAKLCSALGDRGVNILAIQASPSGRRTEVRFVVDDPAAANAVLGTESLAYDESEVVQAKLANRPGEFGRVASRLSKDNININYTYSGADPSVGTSFVIFGVGTANAARAAAILDQITVGGDLANSATN